jgi:hypothetical protein
MWTKLPFADDIRERRASVVLADELIVEGEDVG